MSTTSISASRACAAARRAVSSSATAMSNLALTRATPGMVGGRGILAWSLGTRRPGSRSSNPVLALLGVGAAVDGLLESAAWVVTGAQQREPEVGGEGLRVR